MFSAAEVAPVTTMASAMFFGTIMFTTVAILVKCQLVDSSAAKGGIDHSTCTTVTGNMLVDATNRGMSLSVTKLVTTACNPRSTPFDATSLESIFTLLYHCSIMGLILMYAYLCEYHPPFPHATKTYDRDEFFFLTALLFVVSFFTIHGSAKIATAKKVVGKDTVTTATSPNRQSPTKDNSFNSNHSNGGSSGNNGNHNGPLAQVVAPVDDNTEVLNRDQTEEWKGWMQFMFLLYHYYHAEEVYNAIRIMITCYVWMTGFGNFSFFYIKGDYSLIRVLQMLWRLNFLVLFLCLTQGTTYILYYICLLHTFYFMMVYASMRIGKEYNYTKWGIRIKMLILATLIFLIWDVDTGIFEFMHYPFLKQVPQLGATSGAMWEWYFRSSLDHWSTYLGMVFALNFPITSLFFRKLEAQPFHIHVGAKAAMGAVIMAIFVWWVRNPFMLNKLEYNKTNSYFGIIPVLTYIYFRNITPWLRCYTLDLLHQIGKSTLETYLMQHHIWLTSDAKSLLTLIPGWPKMNFLVVTILYVLASRRLYTLTLFLRGMVLPDDKTACLRNLFAMGTILCSYVGLAYLLKHLGILNLMTVGFCTILFGFILYQLIVLRTWPADAALPGNSSGVDKKSFKNYDLALVAGTLTVLILGVGWDHSARVGAGKIKPLPASCSKYVLKGSWVPVDSCNEHARGASYRDHNLATLGTCSLTQTPTYVWGWEANPSSSHCRFAFKDKNVLKKELKYRKIMFSGDSSIRHLFHSFCRQMGDLGAGSYNATVEKHASFKYQYGSTALEFRWAPYAANLTAVANNLLKGSAEERPDILILGGGAWDRLHEYRTESQQALHHKEMEALSTTLGELRNDIPVTWVSPPAINTWGLVTEDKRRNIREDQMEEVRKLQKNVGLHGNVSFVLDGKVFTVDRVSESYDGVHYPLTVYDAGTQILVNAFDWLLHESTVVDSFAAPKTGSMDNPYLGMCMLTFIVIGVLSFDGFMGASYFAAMVDPSVTPRRLYYEAFTSLHSRLKLPPISPEQNNHPIIFEMMPRLDRNSSPFNDKSKSSQADPLDMEELEPFVNT